MYICFYIYIHISKEEEQNRLKKNKRNIKAYNEKRDEEKKQNKHTKGEPVRHMLTWQRLQ